MSISITSYYDSNTARFLRLGGSGELAAIHRAIWGPGVTRRADAFLYLNRLVADSFPSDALPLLDVGCGVGGTATWLAQARGARVTGVTISPVQAQWANERAACLGLGQQCYFRQADFHHLPPDLGVFGGAYAIESFAHAQAPQRFFEQAAAHLARGARLVIADDFLAPRATHKPTAVPWVRRVRRDWHLTSLGPVSQAVIIASHAGFHLLRDDNLTPYIRTWPAAWLALVASITRLPIGTAYWQNLSGGAALQICLRQGWTEYHALVFELAG